MLATLEDMVLDFHLLFKHKICSTLANEQGQKTAALADPVLNETAQIMGTLSRKIRPVAEKCSEQGDNRLYRAYLMLEEISEAIEAMANGSEAELAAELADILYTVIGTSITLTLPLGEVFAEKHRSNMTKQGRLKTPGYKGKGYSPPDIELALTNARIAAKWIPRKTRRPLEPSLQHSPKQKCDQCGYKFRGQSSDRCPICQGVTVASKRGRQ